MAETAEIEALRENVEQRERELQAAMHDLKVAATRLVAPTEWYREHPLPFLAGAVLVGWWLGGKGRERRRRWR
jgi:hypothetical protein